MAKGKAAAALAETDQKKWNDRFIQVLQDEFVAHDSLVAELAKSDGHVRTFGGLIRPYVDTAVVSAIYQDRKTRGAEQERLLKGAMKGLNAAAELFLRAENGARAQEMAGISLEFSGQLSRLKEAYGTKRLGRDRPHNVLYLCRVWLQSQLGREPSFVTLASLVNAALQAQGLDEIVTEDHIRKNLKHFEENNPTMRHLIDQLPSGQPKPETK